MILQHGPYVAVVELDEDGDAFYGRVQNLPRHGFDFWGRNAEELRAEFAKSAEIYEQVCREKGIKPERPYSGQFLVRATPEVRQAVALAALKAGKSMNAWVTEVLERASGGV